MLIKKDPSTEGKRMVVVGSQASSSQVGKPLQAKSELTDAKPVGLVNNNTGSVKTTSQRPISTTAGGISVGTSQSHGLSLRKTKLALR